MRKWVWLVLFWCSAICAQRPQDTFYYAGPENPLVQLGMGRVVRTITYPDWFQYPGLPPDVRQQLVDSYSVRQQLAALDNSYASAPATKLNDLLQLAFDLLDVYVRTTSDDASPVVRYTPKMIQHIFKDQLVPALTRPRPGYEQDRPSDKESDYSGLDGDDVKRLDQAIAHVRHQYHVPPDLVADPASRGLSIDLDRVPPACASLADIIRIDQKSLASDQGWVALMQSEQNELGIKNWTECVKTDEEILRRDSIRLQNCMGGRQAQPEISSPGLPQANDGIWRPQSSPGSPQANDGVWRHQAGEGAPITSKPYDSSKDKPRIIK